MASQIPEDALHKVLEKIQTQVVTSQRQLGMVRAQIQGRERERKLNQLTLKQIEEVDQETNLYASVGKMFMMESREKVIKDLKEREKSAQEDVENLTKKQKYLEKQFNEGQAHLRDIFSSVDRQQREQVSA
ncbi:Prefoldin [Violaceomyces palustris]|uniref:Prefoldin n=1 Tax=Violaceomyces palustris TaxID=1673888 RepID=A0ACD0NNL1_9BASI|nr:Prefoldin [Violaceomyces palustris]